MKVVMNHPDCNTSDKFELERLMLEYNDEQKELFESVRKLPLNQKNYL